MGLTSGTMSCTHFLLDPLKEGEATKQAIVDNLNKYTVETNTKLVTPAQRLGFVNVTDPLDTSFDFQKVFFTNFLSFSYREDTLRIPGGTFKLYLQQEYARAKEELNRVRLTKTERDDIRDALEMKLLATAIPDIKVYDMLWFHQKGEILFFGSSRPVVERFRKLFRHAFERSMIERNHFTGLARLELPKDVESQVLALSATRSLVSFDDQAAEGEE